MNSETKAKKTTRLNLLYNAVTKTSPSVDRKDKKKRNKHLGVEEGESMAPAGPTAVFIWIFVRVLCSCVWGPKDAGDDEERENGGSIPNEVSVLAKRRSWVSRDIRPAKGSNIQTLLCGPK